MVALSVHASHDKSEIFNVLFREVYADLKTSNSLLECVSTRAAKLATQLNATASAFSHFVDALQSVSDSANNVNGISRDIGGVLTRYCIRQRSIENSLRKVSQSLIGDFANELQLKCSEWKNSLTEVERRHQRSSKRKSSKTTQTEKRHSFVELLHLQRDYYTGFITLLLPVIGSQLDVLDENTHLRQIRDSMELTVNGSDTHMLVDALIEDITLCSSLSDNSKMINEDLDTESEQLNTLDKQNLFVNFDKTRNSFNYPSTSSISMVNKEYNDETICTRMPQYYSQNQCFLPTQLHHVSSKSSIINTSVPSKQRLPLPDDFIVSSSETFACSSSIQQSLPGCSSNCSSSIRTLDSNDCTGIYNSNYSGVEQANNMINVYFGENLNQRRPSSLGSTAVADPNNSANGSVTTNSSSAALIAETLQQIDRLGLELDSYCTGLGIAIDNREEKCYKHQENKSKDKNKQQKQPPPIPPKMLNCENMFQTVGVRFRNDGNLLVGQQQNKVMKPPPLPERRNSTISAATPTAPSIG
ncbi:IMD domain-containing protein [Meloidogyne graminicola]|uniref:IMD domain-containing protein n=1 Tax=Meloidogyne graminicola TaxID=189291 RepID=A0A8T0A0M4_9BILA|nr:IMD domain-containing protein [Meloidogyne graminicola]